MAKDHRLWTLPFAMLFGILAGMVGLALFANMSGKFDYIPHSADSELISATPATDMLNMYQCRQGEKREIIIGGIEDHYSTAVLEPVSPHPKVHHFLTNRVSRRGAMTFDRQYDQPGVDNNFIESFSMNGRIASGLLVIKTRSTVSFENDILQISLANPIGEVFAANRFFMSSLSDYQDITHEADIIKIDMSNWLHNHRIIYDYKGKPTQLQDTSFLTINLTDDHQVDVAGVTLCYEPEINNGMTLMLNVETHFDDVVSLTCYDENSQALCNPHVGDFSCAQSLPLTCFREGFAAPPLKVRENEYNKQWSGGSVRFTTPIRGDQLSTSRDAHAYCATEFGDGWRMANLGEGGSNDFFMAFGQADGVKRAWIESPAETYANCWSVQETYEDL